MRIALALLLASLAPGIAAAAEDDCVAPAGGVAFCALDEGSRVSNVNGRYVDDRWNTLASASAAAQGATVRATLGQGYHYDSWLYCNWGCTRQWNQRDATGLNVTQSHAATSGHVFVGQEEGFNYYSSGTTTRFWEYKTTGAAVSRSVGTSTLEAGAGQTAWRGYGPGSPYATGCGTGAFVRLDGKAVAPLPEVPCQAGPLDTQLPQAYSECRNTAAGRVCGKLPDWPDGTGLPFL